MHKLFFIGGAKGVGKTSLTNNISADLKLSRLETGKLLTDYRANEQAISFEDYITKRILDNDNNIILDTHFAQYSPYAKESMPFQRGLDKENLLRLADGFDISLCLLEVNPEELLKRRLADSKIRVLEPALISEELEFNRRASSLYSAELGIPIFEVQNNDFNQTIIKLKKWINLHESL